LSSDGTTVFGNYQATNAYRAFRWTAATGYTTSSNISPSKVFQGCSGDGHLGYGISIESNYIPFVWTESTGFQSLQSLLESHGVNMGGYTIGSIISASFNGSKLL